MKMKIYGHIMSSSPDMVPKSPRTYPLSFPISAVVESNFEAKSARFART